MLAFSKSSLVSQAQAAKFAKAQTPKFAKAHTLKFAKATQALLQLDHYS